MQIAEYQQFREDNSLAYDVELVKSYLPIGGKVLDLGCGTCTLTNELIPYVSYIRGIDKHYELMRFCKVNENFETLVGDITEYKDEMKYDLILVYGVINYIQEDDEVKQIYKNCFDMLLTEQGFKVQVIDIYPDNMNPWKNTHHYELSPYNCVKS
ncbi:class I SAM-dependent methyltransferase [Paenibacillus larvae]